MAIEKFVPKNPSTLLDEAIEELTQLLGRRPTLEELQGSNYYRRTGSITAEDAAISVATAPPELRRFLEAD